MKYFDQIARAARYVRVKREIDQATAAEESGISLRTIQNIEAGKPVNASTLFSYLEFLGLLAEMLATLPDPDKPTPMELLAAQAASQKEQRVRVRRSASNQSTPGKASTGKAFKWGDEREDVQRGEQ